MFVVRYPNGQEVVYNDANSLHYSSSIWELYSDSKQTKWIASIQASAGVVVEAVRACSVKNPIAGMTDEAALGRVATITENRQGLSWSNSYTLAEIKKNLEAFNRQTKTWKP